MQDHKILTTQIIIVNPINQDTKKYLILCSLFNLINVLIKQNYDSPNDR